MNASSDVVNASETINQVLKTVSDFYDIDFEDLIKLVRMKMPDSPLKKAETQESMVGNNEGDDSDDSDSAIMTKDPTPKPSCNRVVPTISSSCRAFVKLGIRCKRNCSYDGFCKTHCDMLSSNRLKFGHA
jgi:hypothetical protein